VYLNLTNITRIKSSWCIFQGASDLNSKDYNPIACSSSNYTFETQDKVRIDNLRSWIKIHFNSKNSLFYGKEFKLGNRTLSSPGDNDVLVQVVYKTELDDKVVYFVQDDTDGCELHAYKYFNFVDVNDVIRLRSFKVFDK
jgi:hypothetical protein